MNTRAMRLLNLLQLEQVDDNLFRAENEPENGQRIFGGQVIAQALIASSRTLDGYRMHSCHAYFLRPGDNNKPVLLEVERVRDGRSFAMRRVVAIQNGQAIFNMDISFHIDEPGFQHSEPMPNVPTPQELRPDDEVAKALDGSDADPRLSPMAKLERPFERSHRRRIAEAFPAGPTKAPLLRLAARRALGAGTSAPGNFQICGCNGARPRLSHSFIRKSLLWPSSSLVTTIVFTSIEGKS